MKKIEIDYQIIDFMYFRACLELANKNKDES